MAIGKKKKEDKKATIERLEEELSRYTTELNETKETLKSRSIELDQTKETLAKSTLDHNEAITELKSSMLIKTENEKESLRKDMDIQISKLQNENELLLRKNHDLQSGVTTMNSFTNTLKQDLESNQKDKEELVDSLQKSRSSIKDLNYELDLQEKKETELKLVVQKLKLEISEKESKIAALHKQNLFIDLDIKQVKEELEMQQQINQKLSSTVQEYKEKFEEEQKIKKEGFIKQLILKAYTETESFYEKHKDSLKTVTLTFSILLALILLYGSIKLILNNEPIYHIIPNILIFFMPLSNNNCKLANILYRDPQSLPSTQEHSPIAEISAKDYSGNSSTLPHLLLQEISNDWSEPVVIRGIFRKTNAVKMWYKKQYLSKDLIDTTTTTTHTQVHQVDDLIQDNEIRIKDNEIGRSIIAEVEETLVRRDLDLNKIWQGFGTSKYHQFLLSISRRQQTQGENHPTTTNTWQNHWRYNFYAQIYGTEKWYFLSPKQSSLLMPTRNINKNGNLLGKQNDILKSSITTPASDDEMHDYLPLRYVDLKPGDLLYIPEWQWFSSSPRSRGKKNSLLINLRMNDGIDVWNMMKNSLHHTFIVGYKNLLNTVLYNYKC